MRGVYPVQGDTFSCDVTTDEEIRVETERNRRKSMTEGNSGDDQAPSRNGFRSLGSRQIKTFRAVDGPAAEGWKEALINLGAREYEAIPVDD